MRDPSSYCISQKPTSRASGAKSLANVISFTTRYIELKKYIWHPAVRKKKTSSPLKASRMFYIYSRYSAMKTAQGGTRCAPDRGVAYEANRIGIQSNDADRSI
jgi:hypothetical protein